MLEKIGTMTKVVEHGDGVTLTEKFGFTVEEDSKILTFDYFNHPEYGNVLLLGDQVFFLGFWTMEDLRKLSNIVISAIATEMGNAKRSTKGK